MSTLQQLNVFVNDRLAAAAEEIFGAVEKTMVEYQEELYQQRKEVERLRKLLLDLGHKTDDLLSMAPYSDEGFLL